MYRYKKRVLVLLCVLVILIPMITFAEGEQNSTETAISTTIDSISNIEINNESEFTTDDSIQIDGDEVAGGGGGGGGATIPSQPSEQPPIVNNNASLIITVVPTLTNEFNGEVTQLILRSGNESTFREGDQFYLSLPFGVSWNNSYSKDGTITNASYHRVDDRKLLFTILDTPSEIIIPINVRIEAVVIGELKVTVEAPPDSSVPSGQATIANIIDNESNKGDSIPPTFESLEVSPKELNVGDTLRVSAKVNDNYSGVKNVDVTFFYPLGNRLKMNNIHLEYDKDKQLWVGEYKISDTDINGLWKLESYQATDIAGNSRYIFARDDSNFDDYYYIVNNPVEVDVSPPTVESIEITPKVVEVGQDIIIKIKASDQSGIQQVNFTFKRPIVGNTIRNIDLYYDENYKLWVGNYTVSPFDVNGVWEFGELQIYDTLGNGQVITQSDPLKTKDINVEVRNPSGGDFTPPVIEWIKFSKNNLVENETALIEARIIDDISGAREVGLYFISPTGNNSKKIDLNNNDNNGIWEGVYKASEYDAEGKWSLSNISVRDQADNTKLYYPRDFPNQDELYIMVSHANESGGGGGAPSEPVLLVEDNNLRKVLEEAAQGQLTLTNISKVEVVQGNNRGIEFLSALSKFENIKVLNLKDNNIKNIRGLDIEFPFLEEVDLRGNPLNSNSEQIIQTLQSIGVKVLFDSIPKFNIETITELTNKVIGQGIPSTQVKIYKADSPADNENLELIGEGIIQDDNTFSIDITPQQVGQTIKIRTEEPAGKSMYDHSLDYQESYISTSINIYTVKDSTTLVDECFIATASYGSKFEPAVVILRQFRDKYLLTNSLGEKFVEFYYKNSPPIADSIRESEFLKFIVRGVLTPIVAVVYLLFHPALMYTALLGILSLLVLRYKKKLV